MKKISERKRIVVKVGTSTLTHKTGRLNIRRVEQLVKTLADLYNAGHEVILVSSGAIGLGMGKLGLRERPKDTKGKQACAAVGQCELMYMYDNLFSNYSITVAQLLFLESEDPGKDIQLYINSPGGMVTAGLAIYDTMQYIKCDVSTICIGLAASMGAFLLSGGTKGKRLALPNAEIMIHQPSGGAKGQATEIQIAAENILKTKKRLNEILAANTGKPYDVIAADTERDYYMSAEEAKAYGLIDDVITNR